MCFYEEKATHVPRLEESTLSTRCAGLEFFSMIAQMECRSPVWVMPIEKGLVYSNKRYKIILSLGFNGDMT